MYHLLYLRFTCASCNKDLKADEDIGNDNRILIERCEDCKEHVEKLLDESEKTLKSLRAVREELIVLMGDI